MTADCTISIAETRPDVAAIRALLIEYQRHIAVDLDFQDFGEELAALPGPYAPPRGRLFLARCGTTPAGCVAIRPMEEEGVCELKRLYVRSEFMGKRVGRALFEHAMHDAKALGYTTMRLDSLRRFEQAGRLYKYYGFREIAPFNNNPHKDVYYLEREL